MVSYADLLCIEKQLKRDENDKIPPIHSAAFLILVFLKVKYDKVLNM